MPAAARAAVRAMRMPDLGTPGVLKRATISARQQGICAHHSDEFERWASEHAPIMMGRDSLDRSLEAYLDSLFVTGQNPYAARMAIYGYGFSRDVDVSRQALPRTHRALRGFLRSAPDVERDPMPWDVCLGLALDLTEPERDEADRVCAAALVTQFDTYARPTELLELRVPRISWCRAGNARQRSSSGHAMPLLREIMTTWRQRPEARRGLGRRRAAASTGPSSSGRKPRLWLGGPSSCRS